MNSKLTLVPDFTHALYFKLHKLQNKHKLLPDKLACQSKTDLAYTMIKRNTPSYNQSSASTYSDQSNFSLPLFPP